MNISLVGAGYVGTVTAACLADSGHNIIAVDTDSLKIKYLNEGLSPIVEKGLGELISKNKNNIRATQDIREAVLNTNITLICVGTPSADDGSLDLTHVINVCRQIGEAIKDKDTYHSVALRSTVLPGTARDTVIPALEQSSGKKLGEGFGFANNPEFLREGSAIYDYYNPPKIVIGECDTTTSQAIAELYKDISASLAITSVEVAEGVKYADNAWHAAKVGFANELGNILKENGVDSHKVMEIFFLDTKLNISRNYLMPGFAFGGSCLPKDVRAIRAAGRQKNLNTPFFDALLKANDEQIGRAYRMIRNAGLKKIAMLGLAFKTGTDDLRESPLLSLAGLLLRDGCHLKIYDPSVSKSLHIPDHIRDNLVEVNDTGFLSSDIFVIGNADRNYSEILKNISEDAMIIDLVRLKGADHLEKRKNYNGICW